MPLTRSCGCAGSSEPSLVACAKLPLPYELASFIDSPMQKHTKINLYLGLCVCSYVRRSTGIIHYTTQDPALITVLVNINFIRVCMMVF